jgi:hypothetical protein
MIGLATSCARRVTLPLETRPAVGWAAKELALARMQRAAPLVAEEQRATPEEPVDQARALVEVDHKWQQDWGVTLQDTTLVRQLEVDYIRVYQQVP